MTEKQEEQMIKAAHKYWADKSGGYDKEEIMVDAFVEGYKQAFALYNVVGQSEQLVLFADWLQYNGKWDLPEKQVKNFLSEQKQN